MYEVPHDDLARGHPATCTTWERGLLWCEQACSGEVRQCRRRVCTDPTRAAAILWFVDDTFVLGELRLVSDVSSADWIVASVRNFECDVGSLLPVTFDAYARVFHPAGRRRDTDAAAEEVSWSQVAAANGRVAHASMEWIAITGDWRYLDRESQPGVWGRPPSRGSLPANQIAVLARVLERFTTTPSTCWFAVWDGSGRPVYPRPVHTVPMPNRPMALFAGPLGAVTTSFGGQPFECAHLWWPEDRSWCVAGDVDLMSTYVAGSAECVAAVLAVEDLESCPVTVDQSVTWDSDTVNPTPSGSAEIGGTPISRRHSRRLQRTPRTTSSSRP
jgi:hypothetical protein